MRALRRAALILTALVVLVAAYPLWLGYRVWAQSHDDEVHSADAIVVLGAAQYNGRPSPVFKARLDHAAYLYGEDLADVVILTGGKRSGDRFTEAEAGQMYLVENTAAVPSDVILSEGQGRTTLESLEAVGELAEQNGIDTALFVSDPLHSERIKRMASDLGFESVYTSPASYVALNRSRETKLRELVHEVVAILAYEFLSK